jgi:lipopolysaccharide/colanic/teichoic acid biosynthesis glycosyltransferase
LFNVLLGDEASSGRGPSAQHRHQLAAADHGLPVAPRGAPGITGLAQISHHYDTSMDVRRKGGLDLEYIGSSRLPKTSDHAPDSSGGRARKGRLVAIDTG